MAVIRGTVQAELLSGYGNGYGYGYGDGSGDGYGNGYGYGYGDGDGYWIAVLTTAIPPDHPARQAGAMIAFWKSGADGRPCNGGRGAPVHVGKRETIVGPLVLCARAFHATLRPEQWEGERLWIVALHGEVEGDAEKYGALTREILAEVK